MATFVLAVAFVHLGGLVDASAQEWLRVDPEPPLHPTILRSAYKGQYYPIIAAKRDRAEILVDGKLRRVDPHDGYEPARAPAYARGFVQFSAQTSSANVTNRVYEYGNGKESPAGTMSKNGTYEATLQPSESYEDCYLALVFFQTALLGDPKFETIAISFWEVGPLTAGKPTKLSINEAYVPASGTSYNFFPLLFSKGVEIRSNQSEVAARFFRWREMKAHRKILAAYLQQNPSASLPAKAYLRVPPVLTDDIDVKTLPAVIHTSFTVGESGEVQSLQIEESVDGPVFEAIQRAVNGWLFTPKLMIGRPVPAVIKLPLSFDPARS